MKHTYDTAHQHPTLGPHTTQSTTVHTLLRARLSARRAGGWLDHDDRVGLACANRTLLVPRLLALRVVGLHAVEGALGVGAVLDVRLVLGVLRVLEVLCVLLRVLRQRGLLRAPRRLARVCCGLRATPQRDRVVIVRALLVLLGVVLLVLLVLVLPLAASALAAAAVLGGTDGRHVRVVLGVPLGAVLLHLPPGVLLVLLLLRLRLRRLLL